ncbi:MAG: pilus assembly protein [Elusimicrobiota bacterium]|jgi:hypothetical protein|nr:pilus assembly protein [Elusimicrobiota bacterium]
MKNNRGQAMIEAVVTIVFITIIMFSFLQICIIVVDDMTANEAAFVAMRSAAVTPSQSRSKEAKSRAENYLMLFYPFSAIDSAGIVSNFAFSDKNEVEKYFAADNNGETLEDSAKDSKDAVTLWNGEKKTKDYSGSYITKQTVKIYYFTRTMFGSLTAPKNSKKHFFESGRRRYQSARNRMFPSPDEKFYYKAYPNGERFKDYSLLD